MVVFWCTYVLGEGRVPRVPPAFAPPSSAHSTAPTTTLTGVQGGGHCAQPVALGAPRVRSWRHSKVSEWQAGLARLSAAQGLFVLPARLPSVCAIKDRPSVCATKDACTHDTYASALPACLSSVCRYELPVEEAAIDAIFARMEAVKARCACAPQPLLLLPRPLGCAIAAAASALVSAAAAATPGSTAGTVPERAPTFSRFAPLPFALQQGGRSCGLGRQQRHSGGELV